ncbi:MAG TPA: hypothetical protein VFT49_01685 [Candidatus Saccharimonadales bacterium]|nr:hypothetical protein [Candidatus Saccharimonadales bacterium]
MLLGIHIIVALASLVSTGLALISPSTTKLRASYELIALTVVSGTYLVLHTHLPLTQACLTGLTYLGISSLAVVLARHKLARQKI